MSGSNKRFRNHIRKFGFKIRKIPFRPDILSVQFMNKHLMVIPRTIYPFPSLLNTDMLGHTHPDYFDLEKRAIEMNLKVKRSNFLSESWYYERLEASQI
jgi:hypothetical protein